MPRSLYLLQNSTINHFGDDLSLDLKRRNSLKNISKPIKQHTIKSWLSSRFSRNNLIQSPDECMNMKTKSSSNSNELEAILVEKSADVCLLVDSPFRIIRAAEAGNLDEFIRLYQFDNSRLSVKDGKGRTVGHQAAARNKVNILEYIFDQNGDLNCQDTIGNTPIHTAVENDSFDAIKFLLEIPVETNILNEKNLAPIHLATELNKVAALKLMGKYREIIDIQQGGEHGRTALHLAAIYDHEECARILITEFDASPRASCNLGYYPIHEAAKNASSKTMEVFLQWGESRGCSREEMISFYDSEGNVPLHSAVHGGDIRAVELCLKSGAKISTQQHDLSTPVHLACAQGAIDIVKMMFKMQPVEKKISLLCTDIQKMTPLHCASMFDHAELVEFLVLEGGDINALDKERRSPILLAASRSCWRTVHVLIKLGANVQLKDVTQRNLLHLIIINGGRCEEFAKEICATSNCGWSDFLNEKDNIGCSPLHYASREGSLGSLMNLIRLGACINLKNNNNESPLHFAARYGRYNTVKQLLDSDKGTFIINECDGEGLTPLHIASQHGHTRVVQLLLNRGALLHRDHNGRNPLHLAARGNYTQTLELLHLVHSHLIDQVDKDGNTPLHLAAMENRPNAIAMLLTLGCKLLYNNMDMSAIDYAIYYKYPEAALSMVTHEDRAEEVMCLRSDKHPCVTLALIASMPSVFGAVQDKCITKANCKKDSKSFYIKYSFSCLFCPQKYEQMDKKTGDALVISEPIPLHALNIKYCFRLYEKSEEKIKLIREKLNDPKWRAPPLQVVNMMVTHGRVELLSHPLSQKYLQMKWNSYGKYFHLANLLIYSVFLIFVTIYSSQLMNSDHKMIQEKFHSDPQKNLNLSLPFDNNFNGELERNIKITPIMTISGIAIMIYILLMSLREIIQIYQQRFHYLFEPINFVSWLLYIAATIMVSPIFMNGYKCDALFSSASLTVFLSWFNLLLYLQRFDQIGIYVVMFLEILQTLIKVLAVFSILFIAFGLSFFILLSNVTNPQPNHLSFTSIPMSLMRTFSMMLGEMDFIGTFIQPYHANNLPYPYASFIILFYRLFMILMPILLMNLLIGLAVGDIESVRRNAQLKRLAMQVVLHTELERKLPHIWLEKIDKMELIEYPNEDKCKLGFFDSICRKWLANPFTNSGNANLDIMLDTNEDYISYEMEKQKRKLKEMTKMIEQQHQLLRLIVQKMEIKTESDDIDEGVSVKELRPINALLSKSSSKWNSPRNRKKLKAVASFNKNV
ncbi:CLUMA_CG000050, isoform A [Clunio marinus]|uniref:CLUMA_CG000050, isoform A n=1 Tax=Clunio marinus TaxID=568069 RepID=A0A1J1HDZ7_9DIPT|nr:CLUMA_CG000050, isoform A [Clunio marinus]